MNKEYDFGKELFDMFKSGPATKNDTAKKFKDLADQMDDIIKKLEKQRGDNDSKR